MSAAPRVYVVDDHPDVRNALRLLLRSVAIEAKAYGSADEFLADFAPEPSQQTLLLLDVRMPGMSGMALLEQLRTQCPSLPVIMITGHGDIDMAVRAMKLGAMDFITKPFSAQGLLDRIQDVLRRVAEAGRSDLDSNSAASRLDQLTTREREVFDRIVAGQSNKAIAIDLGISVRTVESHRARLMDKLKAKTLVDLVLLAVEGKQARA
ncbi:MAG: response regulator [Chromatiaceae bacterium]|nr:response regulator [Chromatiaceae bacterium]